MIDEGNSSANPDEEMEEVFEEEPKLTVVRESGRGRGRGMFSL